MAENKYGLVGEAYLWGARDSETGSLGFKCVVRF